MNSNRTRTLRKCPKGHTFYKSSDCPTCPECEKLKKPAEEFLSVLSAPARRALESRKITSLKQLSQWEEKELLKLHGLGPASIPVLKSLLRRAGMTFKVKR